MLKKLVSLNLKLYAGLINPVKERGLKRVVKEIPFVKYTLCGNKFVIADETVKPVLKESEKRDFAYQATDMYYGIGSDNFIVIQPCNTDILQEINKSCKYWKRLPEAADADYIFRIFEPDGKEAFTGGNGMLCVADHLYRKYGIKSALIMTQIPKLHPEVLSAGMDFKTEMAWSDMGIPSQLPMGMINPSVTAPYDDKIETVGNIRIDIANSRIIGKKENIALDISGYLIFTGEPHFVIFPESGFSSKELADQILKPLHQKLNKSTASKTDYSSWIIHEIGTALNKSYSEYFPIGVNIDFVRVKDNKIEYRCFERGINREIWASGTGAVAAAFVAKRLQMIDSEQITILPYLSRMRDPDSRLYVKESGENYILSGKPFFLFQGISSIRNRKDKSPVSEIKSVEQPFEESDRNYLLYGDYVVQIPVCRRIPEENLQNKETVTPDTKITENKYSSEHAEKIQIIPLIKFKLIAGAIIILILTLCFNASLSLNHLKKLYKNAVIFQVEESGKSVTDSGGHNLKALNEKMLNRNFKRLGIIITCGSFLLIIINLMILKADHLQKIPKKKISVAIFSVILLAQIIFSGLNIYDLLHVLNNLSDIESTARFNEMIPDSLTVLVISTFFFAEMLIILFHFIEQEFSKPVKVHYGVIRPATFLFFFSFALCISFLPLYMEKLYKPFLGLSKDMVMGLPISVRTFFVGISFFIAGVWLDHRGWHEPFFIGLFLSVTGFFYCWLAPNALHFIIACGVVGFGYGLYLMASQGFIISYTDEKSKAQGFAQLFSGVYAGMLCGSAAGAILAETVGYNYVFFISAVILFSVIIYTFLFMRDAMRKPEYHPDEPSHKDINIRQIFLFLFDRNIITLFLFSSLFVNMTMTGFIEYFNPVYLNRIGVSQSNIGRTFMLYSFCIVYIGPFISKYIDVSGNKKMYIFINGIIGSAGCIIFYLLDGLPASFTAVLMLGISLSFVFVSQNTYMLKFKVAQELGGGKAIAVFRSASRIGQVAGPIVFSWLIISMGTNSGIAFFGFAYLTASFLFFLLARKENN